MTVGWGSLTGVSVAVAVGVGAPQALQNSLFGSKVVPHDAQLIADVSPGEGGV